VAGGARPVEHAPARCAPPVRASYCPLGAPLSGPDRSWVCFHVTNGVGRRVVGHVRLYGGVPCGKLLEQHTYNARYPDWVVPEDISTLKVTQPGVVRASFNAG
jgi:hypothetical protein